MMLALKYLADPHNPNFAHAVITVGITLGKKRSSVEEMRKLLGIYLTRFGRSPKIS